ncbi:MAG: thioester domain-containing protein [Acidimicrobiales bacterium]
MKQRTVRVAAATMIAAAVVAGGAVPAAAESEATVGDFLPGNFASVVGTLEVSELDEYAGLFQLTIDGTESGVAYCADVSKGLPEGSLSEVDWDTSGLNGLAIVETIVANYHPAGVGPAGYELVGSDAHMAAGTQAAIWHYTNDFELTPADPKVHPDTAANYQTILDAVEAGVLDGFGEPDVSLAIDPPADTEGSVGELVGPYVVSTTAAAVTLTPSAGVTLQNEDGTPFAGPAVDGSELWLKSAAPGEGTVSASADAVVSAGRVFVAPDGDAQPMVLANTVKSTVDDSATATWITNTTTSESTTTTVPHTTTSIDLSSSTTVVPQVTTTVLSQFEVTPHAYTLPKTGSNATTPLLVGGLALVLFGGGLTLGVRRMRRTF